MLRPHYEKAGFAEALVQLLQEDFATGWHNFERRWQSTDHDTPRRIYQEPAWAGEKLSSGSLLIWGEQGIGDEIMFAGLIPDVIRTGNHCILDCDARLKALFTRSFPEVNVSPVAVRAVIRNWRSFHNCRLAACQDCSETAISAFAATTSPYLIANPTARDRLRARLCRWQATGRAGLVYKKQQNRPRSIYRSVDVRSAVHIDRTFDG